MELGGSEIAMNEDNQLILNVNQAFYRAFEKKDMVAMEKVWSQGTSSLCVHPGRSVLLGWERIKTSWMQIFKNTDYVEINIDLISTEISGDLAFIVLTENILQISQNRRIEAQSIATNGFERLGNHWYMIHHHGSPVMQ